MWASSSKLCGWFNMCSCLASGNPQVQNRIMSHQFIPVGFKWYWHTVQRNSHTISSIWNGGMILFMMSSKLKLYSSWNSDLASALRLFLLPCCAGRIWSRHKATESWRSLRTHITPLRPLLLAHLSLTLGWQTWKYDDAHRSQNTKVEDWTDQWTPEISVFFWVSFLKSKSCQQIYKYTIHNLIKVKGLS